MSRIDLEQLAELQQQVIDLQSRLAHQEDLLHSLNQVIATQDKTILKLCQQLQKQQNKLDDVTYSLESSVVEKPPHY